MSRWYARTTTSGAVRRLYRPGHRPAQVGAGAVRANCGRAADQRRNLPGYMPTSLAMSSCRPRRSDRCAPCTPTHPHIRGRFRFPSQPLGRHPSGALISPAVSTVTASRLFFSLVFFFSSQVCCWRTPARTLFRTLDPSIPYVRFSVSPSPSLRLYLSPLYPISFSQALTTPSLWTSPSSTTWRCWWTTPRSRPARSSPPR